MSPTVLKKCSVHYIKHYIKIIQSSSNWINDANENIVDIKIENKDLFKLNYFIK